MLNKHLESLIWLSRWYNGRAARLSRTHAEHMTQLEEMIRMQLGSEVYRYEQELNINGIVVIATCTPERIIVHHIGDDRIARYDQHSQHLLFREGAQHRGQVTRIRRLRLLSIPGGLGNDSSK